MGENLVEVELRGSAEGASYERLLAMCRSRGTLLANQNRVLVDYSTYIEGVGSRRLDVRVRVTNGAVEIIVKEGAFGGASRKEASVFVKENDLVSALGMMALLGYRRGVACDRGIQRYMVDDVEIAVQEVRVYGQRSIVHSRFFEAEILCKENARQEAEVRVKNFLEDLDLRPFAEQEWNAYVEEMNRVANGVFDFSTDDPAELVRLGQAPIS